MSATPIRLWSLQVPPTGEIVALEELGMPLNVSITMAAIDPTQEVKGDGPKLSTLRILHQNMSEPDIEDFDDDESIDSDLASGGEEDSDDDSDDDEDGSEEEEKSAKPKGKAANKKSVVVGKKDDEDEDDDDDDEDDDMALDALDSDDEDDYEDVVVCTLDPTKAYQQPLQLTVGDGEPVFFMASGAYTIHLTGNYVTEPRQLPSYDDDEDDLYSDDEDDEDDDSVDEDEEYADILAKIKAGDFDDDSDDESDELDDIDNPRITEIEGSDEEEAPALVSSKKSEANLTKKEKTAAAKAAQLKAKAAETAAKAISAKDHKKRSADEMEVDSTATSETLANGTTVTTATATATTPDTPPSSLSKKQQKKLKANSGEAVNVTPTEKKKVQFASQLEQGPTPNGNKSPAQPVEKPKANKNEKPTAQSSKTRTVNGVKIEDHKLGQGPEAKNGQKVGMRYIGKLTDGKVFDSNKKGKPFTFQLGKGEVIKGWDIGVAGMKVGGERKLVIPANLAYGNKALPGIPKNSTLVFEVKLLEIK